MSSGEEMIASEGRRPEDGDEWSWSRMSSGEAGERRTPDTEDRSTRTVLEDNTETGKVARTVWGRAVEVENQHCVANV